MPSTRRQITPKRVTNRPRPARPAPGPDRGLLRQQDQGADGHAGDADQDDADHHERPADGTKHEPSHPVHRRARRRRSFWISRSQTRGFVHGEGSVVARPRWIHLHLLQPSRCDPDVRRVRRGSTWRPVPHQYRVATEKHFLARAPDATRLEPRTPKSDVARPSVGAGLAPTTADNGQTVRRRPPVRSCATATDASDGSWATAGGRRGVRRVRERTPTMESLAPRRLANNILAGRRYRRGRMAGDPLTPPSGPTGERYRAGTLVVLRELIDHRVRSARPLQVVEDGEQGLAAYLVPRSEVAWPRLVDGERSQTPDQGWLLRREEWQGPGCLLVSPPPGESHAAVLFFDRVHHRPLSWKVDFLRPPTRHGTCLDTLDWALDLLVPLDRRDWTVKDTDDLAQLRVLELLGPGGHHRVEAAHVRAEEAIAAGRSPFDDRWPRWRPPTDTRPLRLPAARLTVGDPAEAPTAPGGGGAPVAPSFRWGRPCWTRPVGAGSTPIWPAVSSWPVTPTRPWSAPSLASWLSVSASNPTTCPRGVRPSAAPPAGLRHPALGALRAAALAAAVTAARRLTGRVPVAVWGARPAGADAPLVHFDPLVHLDPLVFLDEDDPARALARLKELRGGLAAVVVDPLALAPSPRHRLADEEDRVALLDLLRAWSSDGSVVVVADERRGVGTGPAGGCRRLGVAAPLSVIGDGWFGGYGGGALLGDADLLSVLPGPTTEGPDGPVDAGPVTPRPVAAGTPPHPVVAAAGLATLDLLDGSVLDELEARAQGLRGRLGLAGMGPAFRLPPGAGPALRRAGVHTRGRWGFLATVSGDDDLKRLCAALAMSSGEPPDRGDDGRR